MHALFSPALLSLLFGCCTFLCVAQGSSSLYILRQKAGPQADIHDPTLIGARYDHLVFYILQALGNRPMAFGIKKEPRILHGCSTRRQTGNDHTINDKTIK